MTDTPHAIRSNSWPDRYPAPKRTPVEPDDKVALHDLPPAKKRRIWAWLKANAPELAAFYEGPEFKLMRDTFGAVPAIPREMVRKALEGT